jgi:hypothetical protein
MKKLLKRILNSAFTEYDYAYYKQLYNYEGKLEIGYVVVKHHRFFWLPFSRRVAVCCDMEELQRTLRTLKEFEK